MTLIHKERGGGWFGWRGLWWQGTWPFALFEVYDDRIKMKISIFGLGKSVEIRPEDIQTMRRMKILPVIADGIYIKLNNPKLPSSIIFWSFNAENLYSLVKDFQKKVVARLLL